MLGGRAGELVCRRETPSQCGRVGSPDVSTRRLSSDLRAEYINGSTACSCLPLF